jgi:hypothetical protein
MIKDTLGCVGKGCLEKAYFRLAKVVWDGLVGYES